MCGIELADRIHKNSTRLLTFKTGSLNPIDAIYPDFLALTWDDESDFISPPCFDTMPAMNVREPHDRIWDQMHHALRKGRYYSELSFRLRKKYMWWSFGIFAAPVIALSFVQLTPSSTSNIAIPVLFLFVSIVEVYFALSNLRGDISASRIMGVQFHKLAERWRLLYFQYDREDIVEWIELLEDLTNHIAVEHLESRDPDLNIQSMEDANYEFTQQFGEEPTP